MCDLEKEVKLLREKVELLEKIKELKEEVFPWRRAITIKVEGPPHIFPIPDPAYPYSDPWWKEPNYTGTPLPPHPITIC